MESLEIRTMRLIAWERAKGELNAVVQTFWGNGEPNDAEQYREMKIAIEQFVTSVEDRGLQG